MFSKLILAALLISGSAYAAEETNTAGESTMKVEDASGKKNTVDGNIDEEITNARMRAESGSKSKWSLSSSLGYTGGSVSRPFGKDRPNIVGEVGQQTRTSGDIGLDARYRWSKTQSLTVGTLFGLMTPFHGDMDKNENQMNVFDPSMNYNLVGKVGEFQTNGYIGVSAGTSQESKGIDRQGRATISGTALRAFQNGLTMGLSADLTYSKYDTDPGANADVASASYGGDQRTEWNLGLYPFMEYTINDMLSARTVFGYFNWQHLYGDTNRYRLLQTYVYQSIGVGISVARDIYLYPNVQFVPDNIRSDFTNVAMSATLNIF